MTNRSNRAVILLLTAPLLPIFVSAQIPEGRPSSAARKAANEWMKVPMDPAGPDNVDPYIRHLRDEFWDDLVGNFGVLTPDTEAHVGGPDYGPGAGGDPEVPHFRGDREAALIGTFVRYRTALTASGKAIYTDVTLSVEHIFQDAVQGHAAYSREITIGVPGGTVRTAGGVISFLTDPQPYFMQPRGTYVLYLHYTPDGDFYTGIPAWDLSDGTAKAVGPAERSRVAKGESTLVGLSKDELTRNLDGQFPAK